MFERVALGLIWLYQTTYVFAFSGQTIHEIEQHSEEGILRSVVGWLRAPLTHEEDPFWIHEYVLAEKYKDNDNTIVLLDSEELSIDDEGPIVLLDETHRKNAIPDTRLSTYQNYKYIKRK